MVKTFINNDSLKSTLSFLSANRDQIQSAVGVAKRVFDNLTFDFSYIAVTGLSLAKAYVKKSRGKEVKESNEILNVRDGMKRAFKNLWGKNNKQELRAILKSMKLIWANCNMICVETNIDGEDLIIFAYRVENI